MFAIWFHASRVVRYASLASKEDQFSPTLNLTTSASFYNFLLKSLPDEFIIR